VRVVTRMSLWKIIITVLKCFWKLILSLDIHTIQRSFGLQTFSSKKVI